MVKAKSQSLFRKIMLPLIGVMILQSLCLIAAVLLSGAFDMLKSNSVELLNQDAGVRHTTLENEMVNRWSVLTAAHSDIRQKIQQTLSDNQLTLDQMTKDPDRMDQVWASISDSLLPLMRMNAVSGAFFVFDPGLNGEPIQEGTRLPSLYYRDYDPASNPTDYSDILMERGPASISQRNAIPLSSFWSYWTTCAGEADLEFFRVPYQAAWDNPNMADESLGYWSRLTASPQEPAYQMITYSMPVRSAEGPVYGVLGVEVSAEQLFRILPSRDLDENGRGGYALVLMEGPLESREQ